MDGEHVTARTNDLRPGESAIQWYRRRTSEERGGGRDRMVERRHAARTAPGMRERIRRMADHNARLAGRHP